MAHEQVSLPMSRHDPIRHFHRPLVDADQVLDGPRAEPYLAEPTKSVQSAEIIDQLPLECAPWQYIEIGIDGSVRHPHGRFVRIPLR
jgi:hypothetical protein